MIAAFTGWNDAGDAASAALRTMIESWGADALAEIDPDVFTDFATVRPQVRLDEDHHRSIVWPTVGVWSASLPGTDVILVLGPEPALRWRLFTDQLVGIAGEIRREHGDLARRTARRRSALRPVPLIGTATDDTMIERFELQRSQYEGPTGIVGVLQDALHRQGLPTASLWAAVPGYASQIPSPKAAMALVDRSCSMIGTPAPLSRLAAAAAEYEVRVASLIGDDDDMVEYLHRLEQLADDDTAGFTDLELVRRRRLRRRRRDRRRLTRPRRAGRRGRAVPARPHRRLTAHDIERRSSTSVDAPDRGPHRVERRRRLLAARSRRTPSAPTTAHPPWLRATHRHANQPTSAVSSGCGRSSPPVARQWNSSMYIPNRLNPIR